MKSVGTGKVAFFLSPLAFDKFGKDRETHTFLVLFDFEKNKQKDSEFIGR